MDSPQNTIWGPHLWTILHSSAERIGTFQHKKLPKEELRIWKNILSSLRYSLPCPSCKKHYSEYYSSNPLTTLNKESVRLWLYNLHTTINTRNQKPNTITLDRLPNLYNIPFNFTEHFKIIINQMKKALTIGICARDDIQRSIRAFQELKIFYDFF